MKEEKASNTWRGQVIDRCDGRMIYQSRPCTAWEEAQQRAERAAKRSGYGDRCAVQVV